MSSGAAKVVVVESPAKAKTINKYLGHDFRVVASYGHVRDLLSKDGSVDPEHDFAMSWEVSSDSQRHVDAIAKALSGAGHLYLATDPDREGEAISWHVLKILEQRDALRGIPVHRVVFNEVTKRAVLDAIANPRALNTELIDAYLARRALDYLVGFTLSPVLWRKLPGSRSAGRVQSVALRLICEREAEIEVFRPQEYWSISVACRTAAGEPFVARLTHLDGEKLDRLSIGTEGAAKAAVAAIEARSFHVGSLETRTVRRHPFPPFTTSTLQQEASRKLGLGASATMRLAQRLYEGVDLGGETVGLITYMRTDGVQLAAEAVAACRDLIAAEHGPRYVPPKAPHYKSKAKNAQEAHEAIRPTDVTRRPADVERFLDRDQLRLYTLIWRRTIACQMASAELDQTAAEITSPDGQVVLRATGSVIRFPGFLAVYRESRDDAEADDEDRLLPAMAEKEAIARDGVTPEQHFTQPPPRYTEASLVKRLEELGIGRPSTYASILQVLQDRSYVRLEKRRFMPEDRGRLVTAFLASFFHRYVEYDFTADLEERLDDISGGRADWKQVLRDFWTSFYEAVEQTKDLKVRDVLDALDRDLGAHFFPALGNGADARACPACADGRLSLKLGRYGAFVGCSNYPECKFTRQIGIDAANGAGAGSDGPRELGTDPETGETISVRNGPYGPYVQRGDAEKPPRVSVPKGMAPGEITLETALKLLALPRALGTHPESGQPIVAGIGRYGPYLKHGPAYKSLAADDDVLTIGLNRAMVLLADVKAKGSSGRELGAHPDDGKPVTLRSGRFGPYVQHGAVRASVPRSKDADALTFEDAVAIVAEKAGKGATKGTGKGKAAAGAKGTPAKRGATKTAATKAAATKAPAAKTPAAKTKAKASSNGKAKTASGGAAGAAKPKPARARGSRSAAPSDDAGS